MFKWQRLFVASFFYGVFMPLGEFAEFTWQEDHLNKQIKPKKKKKITQKKKQTYRRYYLVIVFKHGVHTIHQADQIKKLGTEKNKTHK